MKYTYKLLLWLSALTLVACSQDNLVEDVASTPTQEIQASIPVYQLENQTRVSISQDLGSFTWSNDDRIGMYAESNGAEGNAIFKIKQGGSSSATFANEFFTLRPFTTYYAFFPYHADGVVDAYPVDFTGQIQTENGGTTHIGSRNYMVASSFTDANANATVSFTNLGAIIQLALTVPETGTFTSVTLTSSGAEFTTKGTVSMKTGAITATETSENLQLTLGSGLTLQQNTVFTANLLVAPGDFSAANFTISLNTNIDTYSCTVAGKNILSGKAYKYELADFERTGYYRSTDYSLDKTLANTFQTAACGEEKGVDIIILGDGFTDQDIASGRYDEVMQMAYDDFFCIEPFTTVKNLFNVYSVYAVSQNRKVTTDPSDGINGAVDVEGISTCFSTSFTNNSTRVSGDGNTVFEYAKAALGEEASERIMSALILVMVNAERYAGTCFNYKYSGTTDDYALYAPAIAYIPLGKSWSSWDANTMRRTLLHHEANGHGFGKLADEYSITGKTITSTSSWSDLRTNQNAGFSRNVDVCVNEANASETWPLTTTSNVYWNGLFNTANNYETSEGLGIYEGAYTFESLFCRPTENSIMLDNTGGFNAPSRWAIYYRVMKMTESTSATSFQESLSEFLTWDRSITYTTTTAAGASSARKLPAAANGMKPLAPVEFVTGKWVNGRFISD